MRGATVTIAKLPRRRRRWLAFSLRSLLAAWVGLALWLGYWTHSAREQEKAVAGVRGLTNRWFGRAASIYYSFEIVEDRWTHAYPVIDRNADSWVPRFALGRLGQDFFHPVAGVEVSGSRWGKEPDLAAEIGRLRNLTHLLIHDDNVTEAMIGHLSRLRNLKRLKLEGVTDEALRVISRLPRLETLEVGGDFTDAGLTQFGRMSTLRSLRVRSLRITDDGLAEISGIRNLQFLILPPTDFTEEGFQKLAYCASLKTLGFWGTPRVADDQLRGIAAIGSLEVLYLGGTGITDAGAQYLPRLANLRRLDLRDTLITDGAMPHIARLTSLEEVDLADTDLTEEGIAYLARLPNLERVVLDYTQVTAAGLECFKASPKLRHLDIRSRPPPFWYLLARYGYNRGIAANDLARLRKQLPQCTIMYR